MNNNLIRDNGRRGYWIKVFSILIPVTIQHMLSFGLNIVDTLMIGRVGTDELAAVGSANQIYSLFAMVCFGLLSGGGVFISQYWGTRDIAGIRKTLGLIYKYVLIVCLGVTLLIEVMPAQLIGLFVREHVVIDLGVQYFRIAALSYVFAALSFCISFSSRCIQRLRYPTIINAIAILINTGFNYILIYGKLGFPAMSVQGAAIATVLARIVEFLLLIFYIYKAPSHPLAAKLSELSGYTKEFRNRVIKTAGPILLSDGAYGLGASVFLSGLGLIGSVAVAAYQVVNIIGEFCQSIFYGLGNASAVVLGERLGMGDIAGADKDAKRFLWTGLVMGIGITLVLLVMNPFVPGWFDFDAKTTAVLIPALTVSAITVAGRAFTYLLICGILRSGGDTTYVMYVDIAWTWLFGIPVMFIGILFFDFTLWQALFIRYFSECTKAVHLYIRSRSKIWQKVLIDDSAD